ncbi:hypothetical protein D3C76_984740 [compost metagenome]
MLPSCKRASLPRRAAIKIPSHEPLKVLPPLSNNSAADRRLSSTLQRLLASRAMDAMSPSTTLLNGAKA